MQYPFYKQSTNYMRYRYKNAWKYYLSKKELLEIIRDNTKDFHSIIIWTPTDIKEGKNKIGFLEFNNPFEADVYHIINYTYFLLEKKRDIGLSYDHALIKRLGFFALAFRLAIVVSQKQINQIEKIGKKALLTPHYTVAYRTADTLLNYYWNEKDTKKAVKQNNEIKEKRPPFTAKEMRVLIQKGVSQKELSENKERLENVFAITDAPCAFEDIFNHKETIKFNDFIEAHLHLQRLAPPLKTDLHSIKTTKWRFL